jgi:hypothetical protein
MQKMVERLLLDRVHAIAAGAAVGSPQFAATFQRIAKRRGKKIATTAVARKLATRAWHLLAGAEHTAPPTPAAPQTAAR